MTEEASWREVAAYLLAIEEVKKQESKNTDESSFSALLESFRSRPFTDTCKELEKLVSGDVNRGAELLLKGENSYTWKKQTIRLNSLRMGGGKPGTKFHEIAREKYRGKPSPIDICNEVKKCEHCNYIRRKRIPPFMRRIIVFQEKSGSSVFRIGDGYHRSVEVCVTHKEKTIPCYVGFLR